MTEQEKLMKKALACAQKALSEGEVPIGAVVTLHGKVIARGHNRRTKKQIATAHAEVEAIEKACKKLGSWRIPECEIYVTLEPCPMCMGAILNARIPKLYFGAYEQKGLAMTEQLAKANLLNHTVEYEGGVLGEECSAILTQFFTGMRKKQKEEKKAAKQEETVEKPDNNKRI